MFSREFLIAPLDGFYGLLLYFLLGLLGLCVAYRVPIVKFYIKYIVFCGVISLGSLFYIFVFSLHGRDYKNAWRFKKMFKLGGYLVGLKPVVKDAHLLITDKPCIFVANHQSMIDVASLSDVWPERCTIISKSSMKYAGPVGLITWLSKLIYIDRKNHKDAVSIMHHAAEIALEDQVSIYIFPEGTRSCTGKFLPFKKGAFYLAVECQFPIQPIVISSYTRFLDFENKRFDSAAYYVQVLPPISTKGMDASNVNSLLQETREKMEACFEVLNKTEVSPQDL